MLQMDASGIQPQGQMHAPLCTYLAAWFDLCRLCRGRVWPSARWTVADWSEPQIDVPAGEARPVMITTVLCISFLGRRTRSSESLQARNVAVDVVNIATKHSMNALDTYALNMINHQKNSAGSLRSQHVLLSSLVHGYAYSNRLSKACPFPFVSICTNPIVHRGSYQHCSG